MTDALVTIETDAAAALMVLRNGSKRMSYAIANALNKTARVIQQNEQESLFKKFNVRRREFLMRQVAIIKPFASAPQGRLEVRISVGQKPRLLLTTFEAGGTRGPFKGSNVAIPALGGARPNAQASVTESLYVKELKFHKRGAAIIGAQSTYIVPGKGIYQQQEGDAPAKLLYAFKPSVRVDNRLKWIPTATAIATVQAPLFLKEQVEATFQRNFVRDIASGVRSAAA